MFFRKKTGEDAAGTALEKTLRAHLPGAEEGVVETVAAVAGLLVQVAYEDRPYLPSEEVQIRKQLSRVNGLSDEGVNAICSVLRQNAPHIAMIEARQYARYLAGHTDRAFRVSIVDMLLDVAAADASISVVETNLIRRVVEFLGLTQEDYLASQARHRDKLAVLKTAD